ncbi:uncharacterized protein LOC129570272, partial [Sitodiplosis mosellana]|uniref:uncharacterized protein LOC129570272 n=1 Tax=Sitodiplosis mosellana TaxID=263140 RepID=UPI002444B858
MPVIVVNDENTRRSKATRAQREIFSIEQTHQEVRCNLWFYKHIRGAFDLETLGNAIKRLTSRVPLLQTRFVYSDGELWQIYDKSIQHNLKTIDVRTHSTPFEEALRKMKKAVNQSGGMTDDHLCEFTVYSIDDTNYILYARFHHSIIDIRSWAKFESLLAVVYNDLKNGNKITVQPKLHFGALSHADTIYQASDEYEKDETFWRAYVQPLKRFAYTQRCINSAGKKTTHRHKMPLSIGERRKLQKVAAAMNIPESFLYVGVSALLLRSILGREHVSLSLPVNGTDLTNELGMTFNVVPLLLHIPEDATIHEALLRIAQETKSILKHQRYRIEDILKFANYSSNASFGPHVNIMCSNHGEKLSGCSCSSHFGGNTDINDLQITFWADRPNGRLDILLEDIHEGHSEQQLATLSEHMSFILDQVLYATNSTVSTLDEQCGDVTTVELSESFYANRRKPIAAGFLQWSQSCDVLIRHVYSNTWVGSGDSPFAATKVLLSDRAVSISKLERVVDSVCKKAPGTVLTIEESAWHVAAADGVVKMSHFLDEFGQTISARTLANQCHIIEGGQLPIVKPEQIEWFGEAHTQAMMAHPPARCLHQLFEAQVEHDGQAIAVECEGRTLSYTELNAQANQLAHYLVARGVKPDDRIALCVDRSTTMIVAMLGIMKAGGAYVPLDPAYPSQRLNHILQDANPIFLLADATGRIALGDHQVPVVDIQDQALFASLPADNPDSTKLGLISSHLAYVIYTSGSTGTPKGVMIEHRSLFSLVQTIPRFEVSPNSRVLQFASCSFDNSIWEIVLALTTGARLCMPNVEERLTDTALLKYIKAKGITHADLGPSLFRNTKNLSDLNGMKVLILGSEAPNLSLISAASRQTVVYNLYGLTETTVNATFWLCPKDFDGDSVPMGRPLPSHCRTYVLDSNGEPVQPGVEGELYIGGAGLARGYLNRPELTAERFLPDPFSVQSEARMYRTGDRARYLPDGNLVYMGRIDQQVKIRGFRIELGEIEAHLVEHPQVHAAVVQPYGNGSEARLVAYVVTETDTSLAQDLRSYLSTLLPDYMVPVAYVCLQSLPLTPNGKLDRRALPAPDEESFAREKYEAPQGEMEEKMANIWRELLGIERISRYDNFFALGGHSLLIVRLLAELRRIGLDTTVREVFNAPTLSKLASTIIRYHALTIPPNLITTDSMKITPEMLPLINLTQAEIDTIVAQVPGGVANIKDIYGLAPLQNGMLFHHMKAERGDPYLVISRMVFTDKTALIRYAAALQQVIERHDILRTAFIWKGLNEPAQVVLRQVPSLLTEVTMDDTSDTVLEQLSHRFDPRHYRLDLTKAPLLRLIAAPTSEGSWVVLQLLHHTIADHSTDDILAEEIHAIFDGQIEKLPTPTSFRHVVAQARLGASPVEYKRFFNQMLGDINEPTLPFGLSDVGLDGTMINEAHLMLPQTLNDQLRAIARKLQVNLASICHLAWAQVLALASGREAIVFGTVLIGRLQTGEENNNIMGPMINTLPIRID